MFSKESSPVIFSQISLTVDKEDLSEEQQPASPPPPPPPLIAPPPDGGLTAWLQVVGGFFAFFNSWGVINSFGVYQTYYQSHLLSNESPSTIAWTGSIQGFLVGAASIVCGRLIDAGHARTLVIVGTFLLTFGMMMTSISTEFYQVFLAQGVCTGIGTCCMFVPSVAVVAPYFSKKRSFAIGIMATGSSLGGVVYPIMVRQLIQKIGFPWATRIIAFTILGLSMIPCVLLKSRLPPRKSGALIDYPSLRERTFILYTIGAFFGFLGIYIPVFFVQSFAVKIGLDTNLAFYVTSILNAGSIFGRLLPNFFADKTGPMNMIIPCTAITGILCFAWVGIHSAAGVIAFSILYGFFSGTFVSLPAACMASFTPDLTLIGTRLGMSFFISGFGVLVGGPIGGALITRDDGGYLYAQIFSGLCIVIGTLFLGWARMNLVGLRVQKC
jgi:MFS family permease